MSLFDCPKCWDTPCCCGFQYESWTVERLQQQIAMLQKVLSKKIDAGGDTKCGSVGDNVDAEGNVRQ